MGYDDVHGTEAHGVYAARGASKMAFPRRIPELTLRHGRGREEILEVHIYCPRVTNTSHFGPYYVS